MIPRNGGGAGSATWRVVIPWPRGLAACPGGGAVLLPVLKQKGGGASPPALLLWGPLEVGFVPLATSCRCKGGRPAVTEGRGVSLAIVCGPSRPSLVARGDPTCWPAAAKDIDGGVPPPLRLSLGRTAWNGGYRPGRWSAGLQALKAGGLRGSWLPHLPGLCEPPEGGSWSQCRLRACLRGSDSPLPGPQGAAACAALCLPGCVTALPPRAGQGRGPWSVVVRPRPPVPRGVSDRGGARA